MANIKLRPDYLLAHIDTLTNLINDTATKDTLAPQNLNLANISGEAAATLGLANEELLLIDTDFKVLVQKTIDFLTETYLETMDSIHARAKAINECTMQPAPVMKTP
jgi:hypothetical protein